MSFYEGKTILVTGAGGSIGSELCRQLIAHMPRKLILFDSSELALYNIDRELASPSVVPVLGDVTDTTDVNCLFGKYDFDIVFHTAAYKHVTLCEKNPSPAWKVNVYGTKLLAHAAAVASVPRFILISTDKAVRPTCVMGRTKSLAETLVRQAGYTTVRLCNVWGSSGSVVPLWRKQIADGKPVTITHPGATRYFIVAWEAARALMDAGKRAVGGETFVPRIGKKRYMVDIARDLGAREFNYIGLQPGEKLHEELYVGEPIEDGLGYLTRDSMMPAREKAA